MLMTCKETPMRIKLIITAAAVLVTFSASAQNTELQNLGKQWGALRDATLKTADAMPDDQYDFHPSQRSATFAERLVKMAENIDKRFAEISHQPSPFAKPDSLDAATVKKLVGASFDFGAKTMDAVNKDGLDAIRGQVLAAISEASEARGEAQTYIAAKDMVTPEEADRRKFLFYGFSAAWLLICLYVVAISLRERKLRGELDRVKRLIEGQDRPEQIRL
jgi:CcmD family protein